MMRKPRSCSPTSASPGISTPSKKTSLVSWFTMLRIGRTDMPPASASRTSTRKTESPSDFLRTRSIGVVRASTIIRSECCRREVQTFWPFRTQRSPRRVAVVRSFVVSVPVVGSVTAIDCRRSSPDAMRGR